MLIEGSFLVKVEDGKLFYAKNRGIGILLFLLVYSACAYYLIADGEYGKSLPDSTLGFFYGESFQIGPCSENRTQFASAWEINAFYEYTETEVCSLSL